MPTNKKQHYLPQVYLRQWAAGCEEAGGKKHTWRIGKESCCLASLRDQCQKPYFYSKESKSICERYFQNIEDRFAEIARKLTGNIELSKQDFFALFVFGMDLYIRNHRSATSPGNEEFEYYLKRTEIFKKQLILGSGDVDSDEEVKNIIWRHWDFRVIRMPESHKLLTCDSPSILLGSSEVPERILGLMYPLSPSSFFVGVDSRVYALSREYSLDSDFEIMNYNTFEQASHSVYSKRDFSGCNLAKYASIIGQRDKSEWIDGWQIELIDYDRNPNISFIGEKHNPES